MILIWFFQEQGKAGGRKQFNGKNYSETSINYIIFRENNENENENQSVYQNENMSIELYEGYICDNP